MRGALATPAKCALSLSLVYSFRAAVERRRLD